MSKLGFISKKRASKSATQPKPYHAGITQEMVRQHATSLYRDIYPGKPLSLRQWRLVEEDLVRKLERDGL